MVVRMVVKVELDSMVSQVLYPPEEQSAERVALLTGIVQLVSTALQQNDTKARLRTINSMKSDRGVVGYTQLSDSLYICEADNEKESEQVLEIIIENSKGPEKEIVASLTKALRKRGREISSLWG